jgi:two-component system nitrate/nitrite response regulator NarL
LILNLLTDRERQVALLVAEGLSNKAIGRRLKTSDGTVKVHLYRIFRKLNIDRRTKLAVIVIRAMQKDGNLTYRNGRERLTPTRRGVER